jgi:hypothetical protein
VTNSGFDHPRVKPFTDRAEMVVFPAAIEGAGDLTMNDLFNRIPALVIATTAVVVTAVSYCLAGSF